MALPDKLLKDKVREVRQLVPSFNNTSDIVLILEHYNYNVEQTVSAIVENGGTEALQSWTQTSKGPTSKQKKRHPRKISATEKQKSQTSLKDINGPDSSASKTNESDKISSSSSPLLPQNLKNPHAGLEKSYKELQRQMTSLTHLKIVFNEKVEKSYKRINEVFKELQQQLSERHEELIKQLDRSKVLALETLDSYEEKAKDLRVKVDRAQSMRVDEVAKLRDEIKDFVTHKRHIDEVAHSCKFNCDFSGLVSGVQQFGEVQQMRVVPNHLDSGATPDPTESEKAESNGASLRVLNQSESLIKYEACNPEVDSTNRILYKNRAADQKPFKKPESTRNSNRGKRPSRENGGNGLSREAVKPQEPGKSPGLTPSEVK